MIVLWRSILVLFGFIKENMRVYDKVIELRVRERLDYEGFYVFCERV